MASKLNPKPNPLPPKPLATDSHTATVDHERYAREVSLKMSRYVRERRRELNLTQCAAAELADMEWRHWQRVEAGDHNASLYTLERVARALQVHVTELFGPAPERSHEDPDRRRQGRPRRRRDG